MRWPPDGPCLWVASLLGVCPVTNCGSFPAAPGHASWSAVRARPPSSLSEDRPAWRREAAQYASKPRSWILSVASKRAPRPTPQQRQSLGCLWRHRQQQNARRPAAGATNLAAVRNAAAADPLSLASCNSLAARTATLVAPGGGGGGGGAAARGTAARCGKAEPSRPPRRRRRPP